jgi:ribose transport system substrate-binding protein
MKRNWKVAALAVVAAGTLALSACGGSTSSTADAGAASAAATEAAAPAATAAASEAASDNGNPCGWAAAPRAGGAKYVVYMSSLNIGNAWQEEAVNLGSAEALMSPYSDCVELRTERTEPDPASQISQIQSMTAAGADAIVTFALSPTAINATFKEACDAGVTVVIYDATVTEPCAYNVSYITAKPVGSDIPFMGYNAMAALIDMLGGAPSDIFVAHGVAGTSVDNVHYLSALAALEQLSPDTNILTEWDGNWDSAQQQKETTKALASFPDVAGIFCGYGESGCVKALKAADKTIPVTGETSQYFREQLLAGWPGVSIGSPPAQGGIAMKVALGVLEFGPDAGIPHDIEVPFKVVTKDTVMVCEEDTYTEGCNVFPAGVVGDENTADIFNPLLPEASLTSAKTGVPPAGLVAVPFTVDELKAIEQDPSRRYITREACPEGWTQGKLAEGLDGCVQS